MAVVIETTLGDITVDLFIDERPTTCLNFLKLCKMKYYNFNLFHSIRSGFIAQTGDPSAEGSGGQSIFGLLDGPDKRFFSGERRPKIRHTEAGLLSMVGTGETMIGSQFFFTLAPDLDSLDGLHCVIGIVTEGHDVLRKLNEVICDETHRPYRDVRITHTVVLEDPFNDPPNLRAPSRSPSPSAERLKGGRIAPDEDIDETQGKSAAEVQELIEEKEAKARATILEIVGDLPDADVAPPENVLFVCKLNPVTTDDDLEIIFSRFGKIVSCEVIRDKKSGDSLQYAFIEFSNKKSCEDAYFKMDNVLIDDRRIHVDFSQSVSKIKWLGKGRGVKHIDDDDDNDNKVKQKRNKRSHSRDRTQQSDNRNNSDRYQSRSNRNGQDKRNYEEKSKKDNKSKASRRSRSRSPIKENRKNLEKIISSNKSSKDSKAEKQFDSDRNHSKSNYKKKSTNKSDDRKNKHSYARSESPETRQGTTSYYNSDNSRHIKSTKDRRERFSDIRSSPIDEGNYKQVRKSDLYDKKLYKNGKDIRERSSSNQYENEIRHEKELQTYRKNKNKQEVNGKNDNERKNSKKNKTKNLDVVTKNTKSLEKRSPSGKTNTTKKISKKYTNTSKEIAKKTRKRKHSTSSSSSSSSSSSESSSSSDSDHKKKRRKRCHSTSESSSSSDSSTSSSSSSSDSSTESSSSSSESDNKTKKKHKVSSKSSIKKVKNK